MIVRTYARRSRCPGQSEPPSILDGDREEEEEGEEDYNSQENNNFSFQDRAFNFSSQDSSPWDLHPDLLSVPSSSSSSPPRNTNNNKRRKNNKGRWPPPPPPPPRDMGPPAVPFTSTLMEAQEFGEMMEHVDEVNFALDGLSPTRPARIRCASLLSLLNICGTPQQRRLLRAQGMSKRIIDSILGLNFDDSPSTIAAAALFFVMASDVQDDHLLDSPACIQFLLKMLDQQMTDTFEDRAPAIGSKLLGILKPRVVFATNKGMDSSSRAIISKVQDILLNCKEIKSCSQDDEGTGRPELSSKWISLLTIEKACLSTVSFEDTCEPVRRVAGSFKERLRELGGLDTIFDVLVSCHSTMVIHEVLQRWSEHKTTLVSALKDEKVLEGVILLLKCLKIMENATFLSKDNQDHLLGMRGKLNAEGLHSSFVGIVISCIKLLSGLYLLRNPSSMSNKGRSTCLLENVNGHFNHASQVQKKEKWEDNQYGISTAMDACFGIEDSRVKGTKPPRRCQKLDNFPTELSISGSEMTVDVYSAKDRADSRAVELSDEELRGPNGESYISPNGLTVNTNRNNLKRNITANELKLNSGNSGNGSHGWLSIRSVGSKSVSNGSSKATGLKSNSLGPSKRPRMSAIDGEDNKDSFDPFAFDEDELVPSKWEKLGRKKETSETLQSDITNKEKHGKGYELSLARDPSSSQSAEGGSQTLEDNCSQVVERGSDLLNNSSKVVEEGSGILEDCLLTSVKVLMNLTNDNPLGCQQIGACGGLDTMVTLIVSHFPSFDSCTPMRSQIKQDIPCSSQSSSGQLNDKHLTDHELDFLVAILGLLVNLVEKDSRNRLRLASARVLVEQSRSEDGENQRDVIPLLCSIFLANQGAGEAAGEGRLLLPDDESSLMQGQREAEMMIIEAYTALLLAFLSTESVNVREAIACCLPNCNLQALVPVLERFVAFHLTLNMISSETHSTVTRVIEACRGP